MIFLWIILELQFFYIGILKFTNKFELTMDEEVPVQKTAEEWKKEGNEAFSSKQYAKAIQAYTEAIRINP